jgi:hypothetical protein
MVKSKLSLCLGKVEIVTVAGLPIPQRLCGRLALIGIFVFVDYLAELACQSLQTHCSAALNS